MSALQLAERLLTVEEMAEPWPHGILDDFLPAEVFGQVIDSLPDWHGKGGNKTSHLPASLLDLLKAPEVEAAIRQRFGFSRRKVTIDLTWRVRRIEPHQDRKDKFWSGVIYLAGDPIGTELYDAEGRLVKVVEFRPNRMICWGHRGEMHAIPASNGRFAIQWWFLE